MKPFNLEEYLRRKVTGEKVEVITKGSLPVRILCTDFKDSYQIIAAINIGRYETLYHYTDDGKTYESEFDDARDLFFATDKKDTKEGWVNICNDPLNNRSTIGTKIYKSERLAKEEGQKSKDYIATAKIEWEE